LLGGPIISNVLYNGGSFFEGMAFLKFSRGAEEEADKLGVQYMWAAGYDPGAMATMFEKLEAKKQEEAGLDLEDVSRTTRRRRIDAHRRWRWRLVSPSARNT